MFSLPMCFVLCGGGNNSTPSAIKPTVTTQAVTAIGFDSATGNGNITNLGGANPTAHGFVWSTNPNPTLADSSVDNGATAATGAFTGNLTGLSPSQTYYVRAFATNSGGTSYGSEVTFDTVADLGAKDIMIVTDIHLKNGVEDDPGAPGAVDPVLNRYFYSAFEELEKYVTDVNAQTPALALSLGDMCDSPNDFTRWNQIWGNISGGIRKEITIGNHDMDDLTYAQLVTTLGYDSEPDVAGSKFNKTFALGANSRVILMDSTFDSDKVTHSNNYLERHVHQDVPAWFQSTLENTTENEVIIGMHVGPHLAEFNQVQAAELYGIIDTVLISRPDLKVTWICGHEHREVLEENTTAHANSLGITMAALIYFENGRYNTLTIDQVAETIDYDTIIYDYSLGQSYPAFTFEIDTTLGDAQPTFNFPFGLSGTIGDHDMVVRWGDGTRTFVHGSPSVLGGTAQKTWSSGGIKTITIEGSMPQIYFNNAGDNLKLTAINQWGNVKQKALNNAYYGCSNLAAIPSGPITGCDEATSFNGFMHNCSSVLGMLPSDFMSELPNIIGVGASFRGMTGLTGVIPTEFFRFNTLVTSFYRAWYGCSGITSIGTDVYRYNTLVTTFLEAHRNNTSLVTLPEDLFYYNALVTDYRQVFGSAANMVLPTRMFNLANLNIVTDWSSFMQTTSTANSSTGTIQEIWDIADGGQVDYDTPPATTAAFLNQTSITNYADIPAAWK